MRLLLVLGMVIVLSGCNLLGSGGQDFSSTSQTETTAEEQQVVGVVIDDGERIVSASVTLNQEMTALEGLDRAATQLGYEVETTEYDFGVLVDAIEGKSNTNDKAWIYYVNGNSGDVGADQYMLSGNDMLEWKYTEPIF